MRVVVDTSVWSLALRRNPPISHSKVDRLKSLIESGEDILLLGVVLTEVLQGVRDKKFFESLKKALAVYPLLELSREDYVYAAEVRNLCLSKGIQAATVDFIISSAVIRHQASLLTTDVDFSRIASVVPLKLFDG